MYTRLAFHGAMMAALCLATDNFSTPATGQTRRSPAARSATVHWNQVPLADVIERISGTYGAALFLDRRADRTERISLEAQNADLAEVLRQTAENADLGLSQIGALMYLGPRGTTDQLKTLAAARNDEASRVPVNVRAGLTQKRPLAWPRLSEPRNIATAAAAERGWQLTGAERIPHDLWPAGKLPELTLAEQLTVLLAGFDLTFRITEGQRTLEVIPTSGAAAVTRRYRLRYGESDAARLRQLFPELKMQLDGDWISVDARIEDQARVAEWLAGPATARAGTRAPTGQAKKVYTLRVAEQPVRAILKTLTERLEWKFNVDEEAIKNAGLSLDRRVSFEVNDAGQEELLKAILEPAGLTFLNQEGWIRVMPNK